MYFSNGMVIRVHSICYSQVWALYFLTRNNNISNNNIRKNNETYISVVGVLVFPCWCLFFSEKKSYIVFQSLVRKRTLFHLLMENPAPVWESHMSYNLEKMANLAKHFRRYQVMRSFACPWVENNINPILQIAKTSTSKENDFEIRAHPKAASVSRIMVWLEENSAI